MLFDTLPIAADWVRAPAAIRSRIADSDFSKFLFSHSAALVAHKQAQRFRRRERAFSRCFGAQARLRRERELGDLAAEAEKVRDGLGVRRRADVRHVDAVRAAATTRERQQKARGRTKQRLQIFFLANPRAEAK